MQEEEEGSGEGNLSYMPEGAVGVGVAIEQNGGGNGGGGGRKKKQKVENKKKKKKIIVIEEMKPAEPKVVAVEAPEATPAAEVKPTTTPKFIDLEEHDDEGSLESLGLDRLKAGLMFLGMKCGGGVGERARRLFSVKGLKTEAIPKKLLTKK